MAKIIDGLKEMAKKKNKPIYRWSWQLLNTVTCQFIMLWPVLFQFIQTKISVLGLILNLKFNAPGVQGIPGDLRKRRNSTCLDSGGFYTHRKTNICF